MGLENPDLLFQKVIDIMNDKISKFNTNKKNPQNFGDGILIQCAKTDFIFINNYQFAGVYMKTTGRFECIAHAK